MSDQLDQFLETPDDTTGEDAAEAARLAAQAEADQAAEAARVAAAQPPVQDDTAAKLKAFETAMIEERRKRQELERVLAAKQEEEKPFLGDEYEARFNETEAKFNERLVNQKWEISETFAREKHADYDEKYEVFKGMVQENPALYHQMIQQAHPAEFLYKSATNQLKLKEMANPEEYEKKLRDKIRAEIEAEKQTEAAKRDSLPGTLATTRGVAGTHAAEWSGPPPLSDILK